MMLHLPAAASIKWAIPGLASAAVVLAVESETLTPVIIALLGAGQAVALGAFGLWQHRNGQRAETARANNEAAIARTKVATETEIARQAGRTDRNDRLIDQLQQQLDTAETLRKSDQSHIAGQTREIRRLNIVNLRLEVVIRRLIDQIETLDHVPVARLPEDKSSELSKEPYL